MKKVVLTFLLLTVFCSSVLDNNALATVVDTIAVSDDQFLAYTVAVSDDQLEETRCEGPYYTFDQGYTVNHDNTMNFLFPESTDNPGFTPFIFLDPEMLYTGDRPKDHSSFSVVEMGLIREDVPDWFMFEGTGSIDERLYPTDRIRSTGQIGSTEFEISDFAIIDNAPIVINVLYNYCVLICWMAILTLLTLPLFLPSLLGSYYTWRNKPPQAHQFLGYSIMCSTCLWLFILPIVIAPITSTLPLTIFAVFHIVAISAFFFLRLFLHIGKSFQVLKNAKPAWRNGLSSILSEIANVLKVRQPAIYSSLQITAPTIWCWGKQPKLLLPSSIIQRNKAGNWKSLLVHELAHCERRDHWWNISTDLLICLMPYNPLAWFIKYRLRTLAEQACDEWALHYTETDHVSYAEMILAFVPQRNTPTTISIATSKNSLSDRFKHILAYEDADPRPTSVAAFVPLSFIIVFIVSMNQQGFGPQSTMHCILYTHILYLIFLLFLPTLRRIFLQFVSVF